MTMLLKHGQRLLFVGASNTDCGRAFPVGTAAAGLGTGFVSIVNALLVSTYGGMHIEVLNQGIGGNTVRDLKRRWQSDVLDLKPDFVVIMMPTNDVWRQIDSPNDPTAGVIEDEYAATVQWLVANTVPVVGSMILMMPFLIEKNMNDPFRAKMDQYGAIVKSIASKHNIPYVDIQAAIDELLIYKKSEELSADRVHPYLPGHAVLAKAILDALGFSWEH
jgi:lysophospholipase L1-like esterase